MTRERVDARVRRVAGLLWPVVLLIAFGVAFRGSVRDAIVDRVFSAPAEASLRCEAPPAGDVNVLEACVSLEPGALDLMLDLGTAYELAGRWADAERVYRQALDADARDGQIRLQLARVLLRRGDMAGAQREGQAALSVLPGNHDVQGVVASTALKGGQ